MRRPFEIGQRQAGFARFLIVAALAAFVFSSITGCALQLGQRAPTVTQTVVPGGITAPIQVQQLQGATVVQISVMIDGRGPYAFVLDTGASTSAIDASVARRLGLQRAGAPHEVSGIGGSVEATPVGISQWSAGDIRLPPGAIDSAALGIRQIDGTAGLLGSDILSQFGAVTIDYAAQSLTVYRQIA